MGRVADAAAPVRAPLRALARISETRGPSPFAGRPLYRDGVGGRAREQARRWRDERPDDAARIDRIAGQPTALWLGDWIGDVREAAATRVEAARADGRFPCWWRTTSRTAIAASAPPAAPAGRPGSRAWIDDLAAGLGAGPPPSCSSPTPSRRVDCLAPAQRAARTDLVAYAAGAPSRRPRVSVYIDAGNPSWIPAPEMAPPPARGRRRAGPRLRGQRLRASTPRPARASTAARVARRLGGAPFVIDTSRNGAATAPGNAWCNPPGRALGEWRPRRETGDAAVNALLSIKRPGESDGACNGGPRAGEWWPEGALALARAAEG